MNRADYCFETFQTCFLLYMIIRSDSRNKCHVYCLCQGNYPVQEMYSITQS